MLVDYETAIENLEMNISWIKDNIHHQFPGWGHTVFAMEDAIRAIKQLLEEKDYWRKEMKAIIKLDVPEWQIGERATIYFRDTMMKYASCEKEEEIVRCKDCKHGKSRKNVKGEDMIDCLLANNWLKYPDWYCADGEKRNGGNL